MARVLSLMLGGVAAALLSFAAAAQTGAVGKPMATDCGKARNPAQCEARQKAREACQGKRGTERRQCMRDQMKPTAAPAAPAAKAK